MERLADAGQSQGGLNRTSVGLKHIDTKATVTTPTTPQSNQRGIETAIAPKNLSFGVMASIEPAWD